MEKIENFINGEFIRPTDDQYIDSYDPSVGHVWAKIPDSGPEDVDRAVKAAKCAFDRYVPGS